MARNPFRSRWTPWQRFWEKVDFRVSGCWRWTGATDSWGYGHFEHALGNKAHRYSYQMHNGGRPIPEDMCVLHRCDNPICVNPSHLYLGTHADNAHDRDRKGRQISFSGSENGSAKLVETQVLEIRERTDGGAIHRSVAEDFGVSRSMVSLIAKRRNWKHI